MPRKKYFPTDQFPYHVTARSHNQEWFDLPMIEVWDIFSRYLYFITLAYGVRIHSFVLMNNHFHLLVSTPNANLSEAMNYLLREASKAINRETGNINQVFGGPYHWTLIKNRLHYQHAYKYVYRNPVEARICRRVEKYPYSSLRGIMGFDRLPFPAFDNMNLITDPGRQLSWLNEPFPTSEFLDEIRQALRSREFELPSDRGDRELGS
jgi:REP element-mobilizing transposase RayT